MPPFKGKEGRQAEQKKIVEKPLPLWALNKLLEELAKYKEVSDIHWGKTYLRISEHKSEEPFSDSVKRFTYAEIKELYKAWEALKDEGSSEQRDKLEQEIYDKTQYIRTTEREGGKDFPALASTRFLLKTLEIYVVPEPEKNN